MSEWYIIPKEDDLMHYGVKGMKWRYRKGPTVKGATQYRKKTAADYGAEVGYDASPVKKGIPSKFSNKKDSKTTNEKSKVSPIKKKEITRVYKNYLSKAVAAYKAGKVNTAQAWIDLSNKYFRRLSPAEQKYARTISDTYSGKGAKFFKLQS